MAVSPAIGSSGVTSFSVSNGNDAVFSMEPRNGADYKYINSLSIHLVPATSGLSTLTLSIYLMTKAPTSAAELQASGRPIMVGAQVAQLATLDPIEMRV